MGWDKRRAGGCGCPGLGPGPGLEPGSPNPGPAPAARCRAAPNERPRRPLAAPPGGPANQQGGRARGGAALSALPRRAGARFVCALPSERGLGQRSAPAAPRPKPGGLTQGKPRQNRGGQRSTTGDGWSRVLVLRSPSRRWDCQDATEGGRALLLPPLRPSPCPLQEAQRLCGARSLFGHPGFSVPFGSART